MSLHEGEENTNADIIQDVMEEVEVTAEEESIPVSVNLNESLEADEEVNDMEVGVNSNTTAVKQDEEEKQPDVRKETVIKPVVAKKYQPSAQEKSISKLQDQLNRHFDQSKKIEDILKQIERKMTQIDKIVIVSNKQHEISKQIQVQFNNLQRMLTKIDKSITSLKSRSVPKSKPSVKVDKKNRNKIKNLKRKGSRKKIRKNTP
jgi:formyltetrahydrofolate synthetase